MSWKDKIVISPLRYNVINHPTRKVKVNSFYFVLPMKSSKILALI